MIDLFGCKDEVVPARNVTQNPQSVALLSEIKTKKSKLMIKVAPRKVILSDEGLNFIKEVTDFNYNFDHCLLKTSFDDMDTSDSRFNAIIWNEAPLFIDPKDDWNFHPDTLSPVIDQGRDTHLTSDINEITYTGAPDLGAFEFAEASE